MISTHESHVYVAQATIPDLPWPARILASRRPPAAQPARHPAVHRSIPARPPSGSTTIAQRRPPRHPAGWGDHGEDRLPDVPASPVRLRHWLSARQNNGNRPIHAAGPGWRAGLSRPGWPRPAQRGKLGSMSDTAAAPTVRPAAADPACDVAHGRADVPASTRTLVAVFASPVARFLLGYAGDAGYRPVLLEPDAGHVGGPGAAGGPRVLRRTFSCRGSGDAFRAVCAGRT